MKLDYSIIVGVAWFVITMMITFDCSKWFEESFVGIKQETPSSELTLPSDALNC